MVGVMNTLVTMAVIFLCKSFFALNPYLSNILGYIAGVINSFLFNKSWVFKSHGGYLPEAARFLGGFVSCYLLQLWVVWMLTESPFGALEFDILGFVLSGYGIATILGNVVYTLANFVYNKLVTFHSTV